MKILKKILNMIILLLALLIAFIILSAFHPELTDNLSDFLNLKEKNVETQSTSIEASENKVAPASNTNYKAESTEKGNGIISTISQDELYVVPEKAELTLPESVAGRNGYEPVKENSKEIGEAEGEKLAAELGYGETGEGLEFDTRFYPYYGMLNSKLQSLYKQIYANAMALNGTFAPIEDVSLDQLKNVFTAVFGDHPELFWLDTAYGCKFLPTGKCIEIDLQFNNTAENLEQNKQTFENCASKISQGASNLTSDYEKEVYLHDTLLNQVDYNLNAPNNQSAYSALVDGQTVCAGYARAYQYMMQKLGIPCYYCTGFAGENHAWNIVSLDDGYYNVDTTWDDTNPNTYDYFNKSDTDFNKTHRRTDLSVYLPACNGTNYQKLEAVNSQEPVTGAGRSLEDTGFKKEDIINSLADYYDDCYDQVMKNGSGSYQFQNVVSTDAIYAQIYEDYLNDTYMTGYADRALEQLGAGRINIKMQIEKLQGGYLLLSHNVTIQ